MPNNLATNLHSGNLPAETPNTMMQNLGARFGDLGTKLSGLQAMLTAIPQAVEQNYFNLRKRIGSDLSGQRKKYRLALESLGWGTLADLLDSAFCGKILNVIA